MAIGWFKGIGREVDCMAEVVSWTEMLLLGTRRRERCGFWFFSFNVFVLLTLFLLVWVLVVLLLIPVCEQLTPAQAGCEGSHVQLGLPVPLDRYMYC